MFANIERLLFDRIAKFVGEVDFHSHSSYSSSSGPSVPMVCPVQGLHIIKHQSWGCPHQNKTWLNRAESVVRIVRTIVPASSPRAHSPLVPAVKPSEFRCFSLTRGCENCQAAGIEEALLERDWFGGYRLGNVSANPRRGP